MLEQFQIPLDDSQAAWSGNDEWDQDQENAAKKVHQNIAGLASTILNNEGFKRGQLLQHWIGILGKDLAANAYPRYIKNDTLFVTCSSPIWSQEITFQQKDLLELLNDKLREERPLKKIVCKVGNVFLPDIYETPDYELPPVELTEEELSKVETIKYSIQDAELAEIISQAYAQNLILNKQMKIMGARECSICHKLSFTGNPCIECCRLRRAEERLQILRALDEQPWLNYRSLQLLIPHLELHDFMTYRLSLASSWRESIRLEIRTLEKDTPLPADLRARMIKLVALEVSKPIPEITEGDVLLALWDTYGRALLNNQAPGVPKNRNS